MPIATMTALAQNNNCVYTPFSQSVLLGNVADASGGRFEGSAGICFGLAVTWLETKMKGEEDDDFVLDVLRFAETNQYARSHLMWRNQHSQMWSTLAHLKPTRGSKQFDLSRDGHSEAMSKFVRWMRDSSGERFFMISTGKHAMSAYRSPNGRLEFFDPNAGMVSTTNAQDFTNCLDAFFDVPRIREAYGNNNTNRIVFNVTKFKKAN